MDLRSPPTHQKLAVSVCMQKVKAKNFQQNIYHVQLSRVEADTLIYIFTLFTTQSPTGGNQPLEKSSGQYYIYGVLGYSTNNSPDIYPRVLIFDI